MEETASRIRARIIGGNIRRRRRELGISQEKFAVQLKVDRRDLSRWERGHYAPMPARMAEIAAKLDVPPWWFEIPEGERP